jgi:hypothetical protein
MGFDDAIFVELPPRIVYDKLKCPVCLQICDEPVQCSQGHTTCTTCMPKKCPVCRTNTHGPHARCLALRDRIDEYFVRCEFAELGCVWTGPPHDLLDHLSHMCLDKPSTCQVPGCETIISKRIKNIHNMENADKHVDLAVAAKVDSENVAGKRKRNFEIIQFDMLEKLDQVMYSKNSFGSLHKTGRLIVLGGALFLFYRGCDFIQVNLLTHPMFRITVDFGLAREDGTFILPCRRVIVEPDNDNHKKKSKLLFKVNAIRPCASEKVNVIYELIEYESNGL